MGGGVMTTKQTTSSEPQPFFRRRRITEDKVNKHFYGIEWIHGQRKTPEGMRIALYYSFQTKLERDVWAEAGAVSPNQVGYRESIPATDYELSWLLRHGRKLYMPEEITDTTGLTVVLAAA